VCVYLLILWARRTPGRKGFFLRVSTQEAPYLVGAGLSLGLAFTCRQLDALALAFPFVVLFVKKPLALALAGVGAVVPLGLFALYNLAVTGNALGNGYTQADPWDRLGFGPHVGGPAGSYEAGYSIARGVWNVAYELTHLQGGLFGSPFFLGVALVALPFVLARANRWDWLLLASSLSVVVAYMDYWASGVTGGLPRYWYVIVPWLALLAARGAQELYRWPQAVLAKSPACRAAALVAPAALLAVILAFDLSYYLPANVLNYRNPEGAVVASVQNAHLHHALIFQVQHTQQRSEFDDVFSENSPLLNGNILWAQNLPSDRQAMLAYPGRSYYRLNGTKLIRLKPKG